VTLGERYIAGLKAMGCAETPTRSKKYVVLEARGDSGFYFVGKNGAVRWATVNNASSSVPLVESQKRRILARITPLSA
jgi:hypothetical protein